MYKVLGIGDSGMDILNIIVTPKPDRLKLIAINTHAAVFIDSLADENLLLNKSGLGTGGNPMRGREAAEASKDMLYDALGYAERVYITCGMGGGTGTGAAHVVAYVAKELQIPCTAIVSMPFQFEGSQRKRIADLGIKALGHFVDEMIVIDPNEQVLKATRESAEFAAVLPSIRQSFRTLSTIMAWRILEHIENGHSATQS